MKKIIFVLVTFFFGQLLFIKDAKAQIVSCPKTDLDLRNYISKSYYLSPTGNDSNSGVTTSQPFATFERAWQVVCPSDTLYLLDGTYGPSTSTSTEGIVRPNRRNGRPNTDINISDYQTYPLDHPERTKYFITIKALNDGKAIIDGQGQKIPVYIGQCFITPGCPLDQGEINPMGHYFVVEGIVAKNSPQAVYQIRGTNIILRQTSGYDANTNNNHHVYSIWSGGTPQNPANILVEDSIAGGSGRKMFMAFDTYVNVVFRRLFAAWQEWRGADTNFDPGHWPWGDVIEIYNHNQPEVLNNSIVENSIVYGMSAKYGFSLAPNPYVTSGNKFLGLMSIGAGMKWNGTPMTWPCPNPDKPTQNCSNWTWKALRSAYSFGVYNVPLFLNNQFQDLFAFGAAGVGLSAGQWCSGGTNSICQGRTSSGNILSRVTLINNGIGTPPPGEGAGNEITAESLSMFDQFGIKNNLYIEGNPNFQDKSKGARLRYRYVDGILMDGSNGKPAQELWPWPMEDRVRAELNVHMSKYHGINPELQNFSVTNTLVPLINQYTAVTVPLGNPTSQPTTTSTQTPSKPGDANGDNKVDGIDYVVWLNNYNQNLSGNSNGDFNNDNRVDGIDYVVWLNNYGN